MFMHKIKIGHDYLVKLGFCQLRIHVLDIYPDGDWYVRVNPSLKFRLNSERFVQEISL